MRASLPMYDHPALCPITDTFWARIRNELMAQGLDAPDQPERDIYGDPLWLAPDLVLSQTCGLPYRSRLHGKVQLVGTADHRLPGCPPGTYNSVLIKRRTDPRRTLAQFDGACAAINEFGSQSGFAALANLEAAPRTLRETALVTGSHAASAEAVARGGADYAAIDAVTWAILERHTALTDVLTVFGHTPPTPALPYICALSVDAAKVRNALSQAVAGLRPSEQEALCLFGIVSLPADAYLAIPTP